MVGNYICDICSNTFLRTEIEFITPDVMHRAVRNGLNPWKTPGIDTSVLTGLPGFGLLGADAAYTSWRTTALSDTTDWGLCSSCVRIAKEMASKP
jgi:hypothetical protein